MKFSRLLIFVLFSLLATNSFGQWKAPKRKAKKKNPIAMSDESVAKGKEVYIAECAECHGDTGKGDGPKSGELDVEVKDLLLPEIFDQTDGAMFWKISIGKRPMPSYKKLVSKDDRWHVVNYIRSFKNTRKK